MFSVFFTIFVFIFITCIVNDIMFSPVNICKKECEKLKYSKPCLIACDQYKNQLEKNKKSESIPASIPSNLWYGLTKKYRDISDEDSGIYLSLKDDYLVKYMKVNSLYIKNSPWNNYYSLEFKNINFDDYDWYLPAIMPLYMFPVYHQKFVDIVSITIKHEMCGYSSNITEVSLNNNGNYYFYIHSDLRGINIKFFGKLKKIKEN